jgi:hypothetical protein
MTTLATFDTDVHYLSTQLARYHNNDSNHKGFDGAITIIRHQVMK